MTSTNGPQGAPLRMLKAFMRERKIPWPDKPLPDATPLGVLLDFALNWAVDFWFEIRMLRNSRGTMGIVLAPGNFFMLWGKPLRNIVPSDRYFEYWNGFYAAFAGSGGQPKSAASEIRRIADIEEDVVMTLSSAFERQSKLPLRFMLQEIEKYTSRIPVSDWTEAFETNVHLLPDHVGVSDIALLEAVNKLFAKYTRSELLHHLSWFFVQVFAPFGDVQLNVADINDERAAKQRQVFCVTQAEAAYRVLVAALYLQPLLEANQKRAVEDHFERVRRVTVQKIANVSWSDNLSKYMATVKLQQLQTFLWPPSDMLTASGLSYLYADFASNASTVIEFWRDAHEHVRALRDKSFYGTPMTKLPAASSPPLVRYDYLRNAVVLSVAALTAPLFALHATPAMLYGGLMFSYALEVVRALDRTGMKVDPHGDVAAKWASSNWEKGVTRKHSCLAPTFASPFPEIPGLEVAHEAFEIALSSAATHGKAWRTTDAFSEQQVFFISACFTLCRLNRTAAFLRGDCNKAFSNSRQFADAFRCVPGSPMNPLRKCTFFD
ncbi:hypothetical protein V5799_027490 [Amblyomma americanum]|uniref:Uncharacterized protein n=1 Tax=Amblyomma americanum TaxID=6943 RepID=A0AAQ4DFL1_AMBAM